MTVNEAEIEAMALAIYPEGHHERCATKGDPLKVAPVCDCYFRVYLDGAQVSLAAVEPLIRERLAQEVEAERDRPWTFRESFETSTADALSLAAGIVRGGVS